MEIKSRTGIRSGFLKKSVRENSSESRLFFVALAAVFALVAIVSEGGLFLVLIAFFALVAVVNEGGLVFVTLLFIALVFAVFCERERSGEESDKRSGEE